MKTILGLVGKSALFLFLFSIVLSIIGITIAKICYHIYLNVFIFSYALSYKSYNKGQIIGYNETYNMLCSLNFFSDPNVQTNYYDMSVQLNNTIRKTIVLCVSENVVNMIKNGTKSVTFIDSYIYEDHIYSPNVEYQLDVIVVVVLCLTTLLTIVFFLIKCCCGSVFMELIYNKTK